MQFCFKKRVLFQKQRSLRRRRVHYFFFFIISDNYNSAIAFVFVGLISSVIRQFYVHNKNNYNRFRLHFFANKIS